MQTLGPSLYQVVIPQWLAWRLATSEVGSNFGKGENFSMKISNWLNSNMNEVAYNMKKCILQCMCNDDWNIDHRLWSKRCSP